VTEPSADDPARSGGGSGCGCGVGPAAAGGARGAGTGPRSGVAAGGGVPARLQRAPTSTKQKPQEGTESSRQAPVISKSSTLNRRSTLHVAPVRSATRDSQ